MTGPLMKRCVKPFRGMMIVLAAAACLLFAVDGRAQPRPPRPLPAFVAPGEELTYEVRWFGIPLGRIRLSMQPPSTGDGAVMFHASAQVDSYDGLPFVDIHARDRTTMDSLFFSLGFEAVEKKDGLWRSEISRYDFGRSLLFLERNRHTGPHTAPLEPPSFDTLRLPAPHVQDGLSILSFARAHLRSGRDLRVPTVVYGKIGTTRLSYSRTPTTLSIDAIEHASVRVIPFEGKAEFTGIFGFSGDFKGWFSDDDAAVPVRAELKVLLGSVAIELTEWKRDGWTPPLSH